MISLLSRTVIVYSPVIWMHSREWSFIDSAFLIDGSSRTVIAYSPESSMDGGNLRRMHLLLTSPKVVLPEVNVCFRRFPRNLISMDVEKVRSIAA